MYWRLVVLEILGKRNITFDAHPVVFFYDLEKRLFDYGEDIHSIPHISFKFERTPPIFPDGLRITAVGSVYSDRFLNFLLEKNANIVHIPISIYDEFNNLCNFNYNIIFFRDIFPCLDFEKSIGSFIRGLYQKKYC